MELQDISKCFYEISHSMANIEQIAQRVKNFSIELNSFGSDLHVIAHEVSGHINKAYLNFPHGAFNELLPYEDNIHKINFDQKELEKFKELTVLVDNMIQIFDEEISELDQDNVGDFIYDDRFKSFYQAYHSYMSDMSGYLKHFLYD